MAYHKQAVLNITGFVGH